MRYLILSDIHGNWEAMQRVLRSVRRKRFDATLVLGDLVGYGAAPNQVIAALSSLPGELQLVRGNHDKVVAGLEDGADFNEPALLAAAWTRERLEPRHLEFLRALPQGPRVVEQSEESRPLVAICHGSPADEDQYLMSNEEAEVAFAATPDAHVIFFGHTHLPSVFALREGKIEAALLQDDGSLQLETDARYLINPGSVGQPRDRDPKASSMLYDSDNRLLRWKRHRYAIARAQRRILRAGLPPALAQRLSFGM